MFVRKRDHIFMGIFMIIIGIICIIKPAINIQNIINFFGIFFFVESIVEICNWFEGKSLGVNNILDLIVVILSLIIATIILEIRVILNWYILIIAVIWLILTSIVKIFNVFKLKKLKNTLDITKCWYIILISEFMKIIVGILCLNYTTVMTISICFSIVSIITGIEWLIKVFIGGFIF